MEKIVNEDPDFPPPGARTGKTDMSGMTLEMIGHAHIDLGYRWDYAETTHRIAPWTFRGVLDLMARVEGLTFGQSQAYLYDVMEREYPALWAEIKRRIEEGRWEFVGCGWCEYDMILCGGESIIRQHLQGLRYAEDRLGLSGHTNEHEPSAQKIIDLSGRYHITGYEANFIALAMEMEVLCVTEDGELHEKFPAIAMSMADFVKRGRTGGEVREPRVPYRTRKRR